MVVPAERLGLFYQAYLSPLKGFRCGYAMLFVQPSSCSQFGRLQHFVALVGVLVWP